MSGRRRASLAVLAAIAAVLAVGQSSSGVETTSGAPHATPLAASDPPSVGQTSRVSVANDGSEAAHGGEMPMISGDGRSVVFASQDALDPNAACCGTHPSGQSTIPNTAIFVRDRLHGTTTQLSVATCVDTCDGVPGPDNSSFLPSISDDGRYVAFLTQASDLLGAIEGGRSPATLVVCDRDPSGARDAAGELIFDQDNACRAVYSTDLATEQTTRAAILLSDQPRLSGTGSRVVWTHNTITGEHVFYADLLDSNGALRTSFDPVQVPMLVPNPSPNDCGGVAGDAQATETEPAIDEVGDQIVMAVSFPPTGDCTGIVETTLSGQPSSVRVDDVPAACGPGSGTTFLGDRPTLTGPCAGGSGGDNHFVDSPSVAESGLTVLFHYHDGPFQISFTGAHALAPQSDTDWMILSQSTGPSFAAQVISRDNAGDLVNSSAGALSEDGRFVAFETSASGTHDGQDPVDGPVEEIVARDLIVDATRAALGQPRLPGALVTASTSTACAPLLCASLAPSVSDISLSANGVQVSFASGADDLETGDTNQFVDSFVRTWQPTLSDVDTDAGDVQVNTSLQINIPVTVTGFGPVVLGATTTDSPEFVVGASSCQGSFTWHTGDTCAVTVTFSPTSTGAKTAHVFVASDQYGAPAQVATVTANAVATGPVAAPADTTRTSVRSNGGQSPSGGDESMISGNGRSQVFVSDSELTGRSPMDPQQSPTENVYVRDLADPQHTVQISLHTAATVGGDPSTPSRPVSVTGHPTGASPNGDSFDPSISSDGRFVSFMTTATDIVPSKFPGTAPPADGFRWTVVVCDRDPNRNGIFDEVRPGTTVPDYRCFAVESGGFIEAPGADEFTTPRLAGNGTRITWVENDPGQDAQRAVVSTLLKAAGGVLQPPSGAAYVPINGIDGFTASATGPTEDDALQFNPRLTQDGGAVLFSAQLPCCPRVTRAAVIETRLSDGSSVRFDTTDDGATFLGDGGGSFDPPAMSDDGTRVAFAFRSPSDRFSRVYVATRTGSAINTVVASLDNTGAPAAGNEPALSGDGRYLAFETSQQRESNAVDPPNGGCFVNDETTNASANCQIVARDLVKDAAQRAAGLPLAPSEIVSSRGIDDNCPNPLPAGRKCGANGTSSNPSIDQTGSEIGFDSDASDVVPGDDNQICIEGCDPATDSFVHTWRPTLATPTFDFGTVRLDRQVTKTFKVTEQALPGVDHIFGPISLGDTSITGTGATDFKLVSTTCTGTTLNDGDSCTYKIRFAPSVVGNRTATLATAVGKDGFPRRSPSNVSFDPPPTLPATLTGVGRRHVVPCTTCGPHGGTGILTVSPTTLDFGRRLPLAPAVTKTITLTDTGTAKVAITDVTVSDTTHPGASGDYTVVTSACPAVLNPGGSCTISVSFVGRAVGNRAAQLVVTDDANGGPSTVVLQARVPKPKVTANPDVTPPGRVTMISGTGFAPNRKVDVALKGFGEHAVVKTDAHGAFAVGLVIFRSTPEGPQTVTAQTHGVSKTIGATGPLLLAVGSVDILQLVTRH